MKHWTNEFYTFYAEQEGVPARFIDARLDNVRNVALQDRDITKGGLIIGEVGCGKTYYMYALKRKHTMERKNVVMVNWAKYIEKRRDAVRTGLTAEDNKLFNDMVNCDILLLDDVGAEDASGYSNRILYLLSNERYDAMKPILATSNLTLEKLTIVLGDRIIRRLRTDGQVLSLFGGK